MKIPGSVENKAVEIALSRLAAIVDSSADAIIGKDLDGIITSWNQSAERIFGYEAAEMVGTSILRLIPADRHEEENFILGQVRRGEKVEHYETLRQTKSGRLIDISVTASPIRDAAGTIVGVSKIARDITELKAHQREVFRLSRLYAALSQINQAIVWLPNCDELLEKICRVLVELGEFKLAWIGRPDEKTQKVRPVAHWGANRDHLEPALMEANAGPESSDSMGAALREGRSFYCNDFAHDPGTTPWHAWAERAGYRAAAAIPLRRLGAVWGAIFVYSDEMGYFRDREIALLEEAATDVSFSLDRFAQDAARQKAEEALVASERRLSAFFTSAPAGLVLLDGELRFVQLNDTVAKINGLPVEAHLGMTVREVLPQLAPTAEPLLQNVLITGEPILNIELAGETPSQPGALRHWMESFFPVFGLDGRIDGVGAIFVEITERKRAEESLRLLNSAVLQAKDSVLITDAQLELPGPRIVFVNPAFTQMTGYSAQEVIGKTPRILQGARTDKEVLIRLRQCLERGEAFEGEALQYRKDGTEYVQQWRIAPLRDERGHLTHFLALQRDVTVQRNLENQFRQAQKMEAFGQLAGGVAHDFNNILAIIQLQAGLLKAQLSLAPQQLELAGEIEHATERGANLTRQLLLLSSKQTMQARKLNLNEVVASIAKILRRTLGEPIDLQLKYAPEPLVVQADAGMIDQIVLNLAVNARDAMPQGGTIVIETAAIEFDEARAARMPKARPGAFVGLSVTDTGSGIPPENLPRIFEPFFTTKEVGKGTGLGLATVFGIVQQHHGWISVDTEMGRGTSFRIYLPRLSDASDPKASSRDLAAMDGGKETILVVEDEAPLRASIAMALSHLGYRVLQAATGAAALELWRTHSGEVQLLLTDMVMPGGMSGAQLGKLLLQQKSNLRIIYASGYMAEIAHHAGLLEDGVNFLAKPFKAAELAQIVRRNLDKVV